MGRCYQINIIKGTVIENSAFLFIKNSPEKIRQGSIFFEIFKEV